MSVGPFAGWGFLAGLDYETQPHTEVMHSLKRQGYSAVEWTLAHFDPRRMSDAELDQVIADTRAGGLEVSEIVVQQDLICQDQAEQRRRVDLTVAVGKAAARNGVALLNVLTGPNRWEEGHLVPGQDLSEGDAWELLFQAYDPLLDGLAEVGAVAALEPCWGTLACDLHSTRPLMARYGNHPAFGINFDPSHFALARNDMRQAVQDLAPWIRHVHVKDVAGTPGHEGREFIFPQIGEGLVDWQQFFAELQAVGYAGYLSVEYEAYRYYATVLENDAEAASSQAMQQLRALERLLPVERISK